MASLTPEARARFEQEVTDEFLERLAFYALNQIRGKTWKSARNGTLPAGTLAEDIVAEAVEDLLLGKRAWDPVQHPKLFGFCCDIIDSEVSHLANSKVNRNESAPPEPKDGEDRDYFALLADQQALTPAQTAIRREEEAENDAIFSALIEFFAEDPLIQRLLDCFLEGTWKRAEVAAKLQVSEQEITNAKKRMERKLPDFRAKHLYAIGSTAL